MTKTELNTILSTAGYKSIRRANDVIARDRSNKIIKGFPICRVGPMDISDRSRPLFKDLVAELSKKGLVLEEDKDGLFDCGIAVMKTDKHKITLCLTSTPTYRAIDGMDPNYETKYVNVRVEAL